MHEAAIACELLAHVLKAAEPLKADRVEEVHVHVGALRRVVPDALQMAFTGAAEGTIAQGAILKVVEERVLAVCRGCGCLFVPDLVEFNFRCPQCQQSDARIIAGNDIMLVSLVCHSRQEAKAT